VLRTSASKHNPVIVDDSRNCAGASQAREFKLVVGSKSGSAKDAERSSHRKDCKSVEQTSDLFRANGKPIAACIRHRAQL
jgi:hypothetical protein